MRPIACFEAGRVSQTQSSWTASCCSRKWMSGHADALIRQYDLRPLVTTEFKKALRVNSPSSAGGPPSPLLRSTISLDRNLSWMSPKLLSPNCEPECGMFRSRTCRAPRFSLDGCESALGRVLHQNQIGLWQEARKLPVQVLVIDSAEKKLIEN